MEEMPKYLKMCRLKFNYSYVNAAVRLSMYIVRNEVCIYKEVIVYKKVKSKYIPVTGREGP
jgi:hypothetical protein